MKTYLFRVIDAAYSDRVREVSVAGDATLEDLHAAASEALELPGERLHGFFLGRAWDEGAHYGGPGTQASHDASALRVEELDLDAPFLLLHGYAEEGWHEVFRAKSPLSRIGFAQERELAPKPPEATSRPDRPLGPEEREARRALAERLEQTASGSVNERVDLARELLAWAEGVAGRLQGVALGAGVELLPWILELMDDLAEEDRPDEAAELAEESASLLDAEPLLIRRAALLAEHESPEAPRALEELLERFPQSPDAHRAAYEILEEAGREAEALEHLDEAWRLAREQGDFLAAEDALGERDRLETWRGRLELPWEEPAQNRPIDVVFGDEDAQVIRFPASAWREAPGEDETFDWESFDLTMEELVDWAFEEERAEETVAAAAEFYGEIELDEVSPPLSADEVDDVFEDIDDAVTEEAFWEWYAFDRPGPDGRPPLAERYLEERGDELDEHAREILRQGLATPLGLYRTVHWEERKGAVLRDLLDDSMHVIHDDESVVALARGEVVAARLVTLDGERRMTRGIAPLHDIDVAVVLQRVHDLYRRAREEDPDLDWDELRRRWSPDLRAIWIDWRADTLELRRLNIAVGAARFEEDRKRLQERERQKRQRQEEEGEDES